MFMQTLVNGFRVKATMDNNATHSFVATRESEKLGLKLEESTNQIKAVNNKAKKIDGIAKNVSLQIDS